MSAAPSWPLISPLSLDQGERTFRNAAATASGLDFDPFRGRKTIFQGASPEFVLQTFKTQNDARGACDAPARPNHVIADCKSPKLPVSQRFAERNADASRHQTVFSCWQ